MAAWVLEEEKKKGKQRERAESEEELGEGTVISKEGEKPRVFGRNEGKIAKEREQSAATH